MSDALKTRRIELGLSQEALAKKLGVTSVTVSRWETGERKIAPRHIPAVSRETGLSARVLRPDLADILGAD